MQFSHIVNPENNPANVQLIAEDNNGNKVPLTAIQDDDGNCVLRTVDAAPFAYDAVNDVLKVKAIVHDEWETITIYDNTAGNSKTYEFPTGYEYQLQSISVSLTTDSTVGDRNIYISFDNGTSDIYRNVFDVKIGASLTRRVMFAPGLPLSTGFNSADRATAPVPNYRLPGGYRLKVWAGYQQSAGDTITTARVYLRRYI